MASGSSRPSLTCSGERPHGADDLLPAAVIEGHDQDEAAVAAGQVLGLVEQQRGYPSVSPSRSPMIADPDVVGVKLRQIVADETLQEAHEVRDLFGRPAPVLGREAVEGQVPDAELAGRAHRPPDRLDAAPMALEARQAALGRPAAVAVHDDGDVGRHALACSPAGRAWSRHAWLRRS